jgi:hypothetical protein
MSSRSNFLFVEHLHDALYVGLQLNRGGKPSKGRAIGKINIDELFS